jgi:single-strand DNA-binding protein
VQNVNRVVLTGNLTRDPELKNTAGGSKICSLRVACNGRRKDGQTGEWEDSPNYFDVTVFSTQGENCARYLTKGRAIAVDGRLDWREWETDGVKRQAVQIIAETVQFLGEPVAGGGGSGGGSETSSAPPPVSVGASAADDDIPF